MKPQKIITILLLAFVGVSVVVLVAKQMSSPSSTSENAVERIAADIDAPSHQVIAYFFHGDARCVTCLKIEEYAQEAIKTGFAAELNDKHLVWRPVNRDLPGNEHFNEDYQLFTTSLVLVNMKDGSQAEWKDLVHVWEPDLLDDKDEFIQYVQEEVRFYLEGD